jgi:hypothetical protein
MRIICQAGFSSRHARAGRRLTPPLYLYSRQRCKYTALVIRIYYKTCERRQREREKEREREREGGCILLTLKREAQLHGLIPLAFSEIKLILIK